MSELCWSRIVAGGIALGFVAAVALTAWLLSQRYKKISVGPIFALTSFVLAVLTIFTFLVDGAADWISAEPRSQYYSFVEELFLGRIAGLQALLPLRANPLLAAPIHLGCALGLYLALVPLIIWLGRVKELEPGSYHGARWADLYRLCGYGDDLRCVEQRFTLWVRPMALLGLLLLAVAFFELFYPDPEHPPLRPSVWAVCWVLCVSALTNILASRRPEKKAKQAAKKEEPVEGPTAETWLQALRDRGFSVPEQPSWETGGVEAEHVDPGEGGSTPLFTELVVELTGGKGLWSHQSEVIQQVAERGQHTLMATAPRSGKTVTSQLLAAHIAVATGQNAMFVLRDSETAREAAERLHRVLQRTSWSRNLRCTVTGPEMIQLLAQRRSPVLTFAHINGLERILAAHRAHTYLLEHLGLVVVEDLERYSGVRGANLHFVLRRLRAVLRHLHSQPVFLGTLGLSARQLEGFAKTLLGVELVVVSSDGAPGVDVKVYSARPPADPMPPPLALAAAEAASLDLPMARVGFGWVTSSELERAAALVTRTKGAITFVPPEEARVSFADLDVRSLPRLVSITRHVGSAIVDSPEGNGSHVQVLIPGLDPLSLWMAEDILRIGEQLRVGRVLVADPDNSYLRLRHLRTALAELPASEEWAVQAFGRDAVDLLEQEGALSRETEMILTGDPPHLAPNVRLGLRSVDGPRELHDDAAPLASGIAAPYVTLGPRQTSVVDTVSADPVHVLDRATGAVVRRLDPSRAPLVAFPGAVLLWRGRRFMIPVERHRYEPGAKIEAGLFEENVRTFRLRSLSTDVLEPGKIRPMSIGGGKVLGGLVRVRVTETINGARRHRSDGTLDVLLTFEPIETTITSVARLLLVGKEVTEPALRALVEVLRPCLATVMDCGEEGLHVAHAPLLKDAGDLSEQGPVLKLIDTYEGGAGFACAADWRVLREALRLVAQILDQDCCTEGCPRCVRTIHTHHPEPQSVELDREGAKQLVRRLIG